MDKRREDAENEIINVAMKVFTQKGYKGATMRHIASEAGINLAMLNYYFRSKDNLFEIILDKVLTLIYTKLSSALQIKKPLLEKIEDFTKVYIEVLMNNPAIPNFIFSELSHNPEHITKKFKENKRIMLMIDAFQKEIDAEVASNRIKPIRSQDLLVNLLSLCIFPFVAQPMIKEVFGLTDLHFGALMERRKSTVADFVISALKV